MYLRPVALLVTSALLVPRPAAAAGNKVDVCHTSGSTVHMIAVSSNAVSAHLGHGDTLPATFHADHDHDGYGDAAVRTVACAQPAGFVLDATDCDDTSAALNPGRTELCNGLDDDCDSATDEGEIGGTWFADGDADGFGDPASPTTACLPPGGHVADDQDCDDADAGVNPNAAETCSSVDDDCDGTVNEPDAVGAAVWFEDADGDGFGGNAAAVSACEAPPGWVASDTDCSDADATSHPGASEVCDTADNDCDGASDEDAVDALPWYADADADGFGDGSALVVACTAPLGHVATASDCDDTSATVSPAGSESCDTIDNDCDGVVDEPDATDAATWYMDADADGFGDASTWAIACVQPSGHVADSSDCDASDPSVFPGASEICDDGLDQGCDGEVDEGCAPPVLATLPLEVIGANGTIVSMIFPLDAADVARPTLYVQIHDLDFDGEGAFRLNDGPWWELQDEIDPGDVGATADTVHVEVLGTAAGYGGLGGLFGTLKLEVPLPPGALREGENTLSFQFVHTDGVTSGFRVLDVDLLDGEGDGLFADTDFAHAEPDSWTPIYTDDASLAEGERLWREAALTEPNNGPIAARCADCHTQDGRDLKYFGYSDHSIIARAEFHELTHLQGELIASYIRSLDVPSPGRPWNPPYQPGPGTDDRPPEEWAAGAGIEWVLDDDEDTIDFVFPNGVTADAILNDTVRMRNIPIAMQLNDWNHWLPDVHPLEGLPQLPPGYTTVNVDTVSSNVPIEVFEAGLFRHYAGPQVDPAGILPDQVSVRDRMANATHAERCAMGEAELKRLAVDLQLVLDVSPTFNNGDVTTPDVTRIGRLVNSATRWFHVKRFEIHQEFGLEDCGLELDGADGESRSWFGSLALAVPSVTGMSYEGAPNYDPRTPGMALEYASNSWWTLQAIQNTSPRGDCNAGLFWQPYLRDGFAHLGTSSGEVQVGRMLAMYTVAFRDVADRQGGGVSMCAATGWEPNARGRIDWLGLGHFGRWERHWSPEGELLPWGSFDPMDPALVRHSHAQILGAYMEAFLQVSLEHAPEEYATNNDADHFPWPVADRDYAGCSWDQCLTEPGYVNLHGVLIPDPVVAGGTFEKWSFAADLRFMLSDARDLFVDLATRQALADFAVTVFPNIDWQSMVDDFGPRRFVTLPADDMYPAVEVYVDPGAYAGTWSLYGTEGSFVGPRPVPMAPGRNRLTIDRVGSIDVLVYPDGLVVPYDPVQAAGGQQTVVFGNASVSVVTNGWDGHWGLWELEFAPGDRQMVLVPGFDYGVSIGYPATASFRVEGPDSVSTTTPASLAVEGTTVTLRTAPITFEPGDYAEFYGYEYGPSTVGRDTESFVTGLTYPVRLASGGSFALTIAEDGTPSVADGPLTVVGQTVWFDPQFLTVTTAAPMWSAGSGPLRAGTRTIAVMPGATYQFTELTGPFQLVSVDAACVPSPAEFTLDDSFSLACAPEDPALPVWYSDLDGDGFGDPATARTGSTARPWEVTDSGDCDDGSSDVNPASDEVGGDGVDGDCSGGSDWDLDGDGHTSPEAPDGTQDDCDDADAGVFAGNLELCDGRPNGCQPDGTVTDEDGIATWFPPFGVPVDATAQLAGAPGAPVVYTLPSSGEVVLCDGTWHATVRALAATDVILRSQNGSETTIVSPEGLDRGLLIDHAAATVTVDGLTLTNGVAPTYDPVNGAYDCNGGGISLRSGSLVLRDSVIEGNTACNIGGGLHAGYGGPTLEIYDSELLDNTRGGLIAATGTAWVERAHIEGNTWGGISANAHLTLIDSEVSFNTSGSEMGGITASNADLIRVTVQGNFGPGVTTQGMLELTDSLVAFNTGDGLYAYGGTIELTDTLVSDNGWRGARLRAGGIVECHGQVGVEAGLLRNALGVAVIDTHAANRLIADVCDFGSPDPDWEIFLDAGPRYAYGNDASFVCTSTECL